MCRHQIDLEAHVWRDLTGTLECGEAAIGLASDIRIEQVTKGNIAHALAGLQPVAVARRASGVDAENLIRLFKRRIVGEGWLQPRNPVGALAGLAVRNALEAGAPRRAPPGKDGARGGPPVKPGPSHLIQSDRSPVSPSGRRLRREPSAALTVAKTSRASASGTLP